MLQLRHHRHHRRVFRRLQRYDLPTRRQQQMSLLIQGSRHAATLPSLPLSLQGLLCMQHNHLWAASKLAEQILFG